MKHTYKLVFKKERINNRGYNWDEIESSALSSMVISYCLKNEIRLKRINIKDSFYEGYFKVKCDKTKYMALLLEFSKREYKIKIIKTKI